jgi:hypothetical protein
MENRPFERDMEGANLPDVDTDRGGGAGLTRSVPSFGKFKLLRFPGFTFPFHSHFL